jgi:hypothetical protein
MDQGGGLHLASWLEAHPSARLVVVDTLATIRAPSRGRANLYQEEYDELRVLKRLADATRITLLVVHHLRKGLSDDPLDEVSGSTGLTGAADGVLVLQRQRGQANAFLRATGRDIEEHELAVSFDPSTGRWTTARTEPRVRPRSAPREELLRPLNASNGGVTPAEVSMQLQKSPVAVRKLLSEMAKAGEIGNPTRGLYTTLTPRAHVTHIANLAA